jgi:hypothetical protein
MSLKQGMYEGFIDDYGISNTKAGKKQAFIIFVIPTEEGGEYRQTWYGQLESGDSSLQITVRRLLDCGFTGADIELMAEGRESGCLEIGRKMNLDIEENEWPLGSGKISPKIKAVYPPGVTPGPGRSSKEEVKSTLNLSQIKAEILKQRESRPVENKKDEVPW